MRLGRLLRRGWPVAIETTVVAPAPPDVVWALVTDWERQGDWMLEARDFRVLSDRREGIGMEAEATISIAGITTRDRVRVIAWEPERWLGIAHRGWVSGRGDVHLTPLGEGRTHVYWREELHPPWGILGAIGLGVLEPMIARIFRRDLHVLVGLARARAA